MEKQNIEAAQTPPRPHREERRGTLLEGAERSHTWNNVPATTWAVYFLHPINDL